MPNFVSTVNFSSSNAGLSTVGYKVFNLDGTTNQARTTSGVVELGTSTGIYRGIITYAPFFQGFVLWDTGSGSPIYASESINPQDADPVLDGVRTQLRSLNTSLSMLLQSGVKKENVDKLIKKLDDFKLEDPDYSDITKAISDLEKLIKAIDVKPVVDFKPDIRPEITMDLSKSEQLMSEIKDLIIKDAASGEMSAKDIKAAVDASMKSALESMKNEARTVIRELSRLESEQGKKADMRLSNVNNAMKQMLQSFEKRLSEINAEMSKSLQNRENYEERLASLKDNMRDILGAHLDMKKQETKLDGDAVRFLMATFKS